MTQVIVYANFVCPFYCLAFPAGPTGLRTGVTVDFRAFESGEHVRLRARFLE